MKKVLIITYYWPPSGGAGVQRWLKFTRYLPESGWQPVVYAPANPEAPVDDPSLMDDVHPEVKVVKRRIREPYSYYRRFLGMTPADRINAGFLTEKEKPGKKEGISVWIRGNFFIPDARKFWIRPSARFLKKYIRQNPVDAIISTGPPHSMHLIALKLKKHFDLPWIADFRDPWTEIDFYDRLRLTGWADRKHRSLEKAVLNEADRIVVVGKTMADRFRKIAGIDPVMIPNGYDEADFTGETPETAETSETGDSFTILHVGAMNRDRNHPIFWRAISSLISENSEFAANIQLRFIGKLDYSVIDSIRDFGLQKITRVETYIPHNLIVPALQSASLLYLPINSTPNARLIQTGKIFEYMASGRPVVGTGPVDGDAAEILAESGAGRMIDFEDEKGLKQALLDYFELCRKNNLPVTRPPSQYSRKNLAGRLVQVMNDLTD